MEFYKRKYLDFSASGYDGPAPFPVLGNTTQESRDMSSNHAEEALMSYFGRVGYDYMGKYLLAFTFREDGYSRLLNKRWGFFPGVSAEAGLFRRRTSGKTLPDWVLSIMPNCADRMAATLSSTVIASAITLSVVHMALTSMMVKKVTASLHFPIPT